MSKHAMPAQLPRPPRRLVSLSVVLVVAMGVSLLLVARSNAETSQTAASGATDTRTVACAGRSIHVTRSTGSAIKVSCASAVDQVGTTQTYVGSKSSSAKTALPSGVVAGTLLVSLVEAPSTAAVSMSGWTNAYNTVSANPGVRLTAWWRIASATEGTVTATVKPSSRVTMITSAFANVDAVHPVLAPSAAAGPSLPQAGKVPDGGVWLLGFAGQGKRLKVSAPTDAVGVTVVPNGTDVQLAKAVVSAQAGAVAPSSWATSNARTAVAGLLGIAPGSPSAVPAGATSLAAGATLDVDCGSGSLDYATVSSTVITVTCTPQPSQTAEPSQTAQPTGQPTQTTQPSQSGKGIDATGPATTFTSANSGSPHTAVPSGAKSGDLLISAVSTYEFSSITFGSGWTKAYELSKADGVRLVTAYKRMAAGDSTVTAAVEPATQVSMATVALTNVDATTPVESAKGGLGVASPAVTTQTAGALLVMTQGSTAWKLTPSAPAGADLAAAANDNGNSEVAIAVQASGGVGATTPAEWASVPSDESSAAGTIAVRPAVPGSQPPGGAANGTPSTTATSTTTTGQPSTSTTTTGQASTSTTTTSQASTSTSSGPSPSITLQPPAGSAPSSPTTVCGSSALDGPASAPAGAVTVQPSQNLGTVVDGHSGSTTYWLAPGTFKLGTGAYDQVTPHPGDTFIGAPGAVLDGQHKNLYAFGGSATGVTISNLTIQNFGAAGDNNNEGVVNHDAGAKWTINASTVQNDAGAGVFVGSGDRLIKNCLRNNGQYGFSVYADQGVSDVVIDGNEISGNNTDDWEKRQPGCGCTGGAKFWATEGATVTNNYVHDNRGVGLWADTNNTGFLIQGNYISGNDDAGVMYEISYNASILDNTFVRNALVAGPGNPGFPTGAIYLSESGSDSRVSGPYGDALRISGNVFTDNWSGVVAFENADRFAGSPANSSDGVTTLVNPNVATEKACGTSGTVAKAPYLDDCRWKTQNVLVDHNTFTLNPSNISKCTVANTCGFNGLFSNYGTYPSWSPYKGAMVEDNITFKQGNVWKGNTYSGPWNFMIHDQGTIVSWTTWRAAPYNQDAGSTLG